MTCTLYIYGRDEYKDRTTVVVWPTSEGGFGHLSL